MRVAHMSQILGTMGSQLAANGEAAGNSSGLSALPLRAVTKENGPLLSVLSTLSGRSERHLELSGAP